MASVDESVSTQLRRPQISREPAAAALFRQPQEKNVGDAERILTGLAGAALVRFALHRKSLKGKLLFGTLAGSLLHRAVTGYCPAYKALNTSSAQQHPARAQDYFNRGIHVETSYRLAAPVEKLYAFWHDFSNLPIIMTHLKKVERLTDTRSRWTAAGPMGRTVSWEAEIIHDIPNELIAWKSAGQSDIENAGSVHFQSLGNGQTDVRIVLDYIPPGGRLGKAVAQLFGTSPEQSIERDLERFKSLLAIRDVFPSNGQRPPA